MSTIFLVI